MIFAIDELSKLVDTLSGIAVVSPDLIEDQIATLNPSQQTKAFEALKELMNLVESFMEREKGEAAGIVIASSTIEVGDPIVSEVASEVFNTVMRRLPLKSQGDVLLSSLLTALISGFEVHMNRLILFLLTVNPALIEGSDYKFTLREIESFESIRDAQRALAERKAESLIREGIDGWVARFEKNDVQLKLKNMVSDWASLREVFARRNAIVHNGGRSDRRYEQALTSNGVRSADVPRRGSGLPVTRDYLRNGLQAVAGFAVNLTTSMWVRFDPQGIDDACKWVVARQEDLLHYGLWDTVIEASSSFPRVQDCARSSRLSLQTNRWIALSELRQRDRLVEEVENWDSSGLDLRYSHVKSILLGDYRTGLNDIRTLLETNRITAARISSHPLYRQLRVSGQLDDILLPRVTEAETSATPDDEVPHIS